MLRRDWFAISLALVIASTLVGLPAGLANANGDYFFDSGSIDALVRGDLHGFFAEQPLMGPLSLLLRAPFVALDFKGDITRVYLLGVIPCFAALLVFTRVLWVKMAGRPLADRIAVAVLCAGSLMVVRAVHWGHPEELLTTALCLGSLLAAGRDRPVLAGVLLGLGFATKQWALLAAAPILATVPSRRWTFVATAAGVGAAFTLPMLLGAPQRFWLVTRAAGSPDPSQVLGLRPAGWPETHVAPQSLFMPLGRHQVVDGVDKLFMPPGLARLTHPLILLAGLPLTWLVARRHGGPLPVATAAKVLAVVLVLRCLLDPNNLDYYHVPLLATLATSAAYGTRADTTAALAAAAGLGFAFIQPTDDLDVLTKHAWWMWVAYMGTVVPLLWWLGRRLWAPSPATLRFSARRPMVEV